MGGGASKKKAERPDVLDGFTDIADKNLTKEKNRQGRRGGDASSKQNRQKSNPSVLERRKQLKEQMIQSSHDKQTVGAKKESKKSSAWNSTRKAKIRAVGRMGAIATDSKAAQRARIRTRRNSKQEAVAGKTSTSTSSGSGPLIPGISGQLPNNLTTNSFILDEYAIGKGSYGYVRLGKLKSTGATYALKQTRKVDIVKKRAMRYVLAERKTLLMASHPFVCKIHGSFQDNRNVYLVLEYLSGGDLYTLSTQYDGFRVPEDNVKFYAEELLLAIEYLHSIGILHRDLKPENCLLDRVGHVKLCDFGFARTTDGDGRCYTNLGTPHYLAPEQLDIHSKAGYTNIVDWWSFGCLLFSLMGGEPPFGNSEDTRYQVYLRVMKSKYKMPSFFPSTAKSLFKKMFIANAKNRLASAEALKKHNWFSDAKWDQTKKKETPPPFKPQVQKNGKNNFSKIKIRKMDDGEAADIIAEKSHYFNDF